MVDDKLGTPTYTHDFARNVKLLIEKKLWGLYNMVCGGETGRYEVALEIVKLFALEDNVKVTRVTSDYFKKEYFAERPSSERLINKKLNLRGLNTMRDWKSSLKECLSDYYSIFLHPLTGVSDET